MLVKKLKQIRDVEKLIDALENIKDDEFDFRFNSSVFEDNGSKIKVYTYDTVLSLEDKATKNKIRTAILECAEARLKELSKEFEEI